MTTDAFTAMIEDATAERRCSICHDLFTEVESMGRNECRRHLGLLQSRAPASYDGETDTYTCCGVSPYSWHRRYAGPDASRGCLRCDHVDVIVDADGRIVQGAFVPPNVTMTQERARILFSDDIYSRNVSVDTNGMLTIIRSCKSVVK